LGKGHTSKGKEEGKREGRRKETEKGGGEREKGG